MTQRRDRRGITPQRGFVMGGFLFALSGPAANAEAGLLRRQCGSRTGPGDRFPTWAVWVFGASGAHGWRSWLVLWPGRDGRSVWPAWGGAGTPQGRVPSGAMRPGPGVGLQGSRHYDRLPDHTTPDLGFADRFRQALLGPLPSGAMGTGRNGVPRPSRRIAFGGRVGR
jgi:hypothetical protein